MQHRISLLIPCLLLASSINPCYASLITRLVNIDWATIKIIIQVSVIFLLIGLISELLIQTGGILTNLYRIIGRSYDQLRNLLTFRYKPTIYQRIKSTYSSDLWSKTFYIVVVFFILCLILLKLNEQ